MIADPLIRRISERYLSARVRCDFRTCLQETSCLSDLATLPCQGRCGGGQRKEEIAMRVKLLVAGALAGLLATGGTATAKAPPAGGARPLPVAEATALAATGGLQRLASPGWSAPRRPSQRRPGRVRRCRRTGAVVARGRRLGSAGATTAPRPLRPSPQRRPQGAPRTPHGGSGARGRTSSGSPTPPTGVPSSATTSRTARRASPAAARSAARTGRQRADQWRHRLLVVRDALVGRVRVPDGDPLDHVAPEPLPRRLAQRVGQLGDRRDG